MDFKMIDNILNDNMINIILIIFVAVFQCILLPKLPPQMLSFADNIVFKVVVLTLIAFMANRNLRLSILIAVLFLLILNIANNNNIEKYCNLQTGAGHCTSGSHNYDTVKQKGAGHCTSGSHNYDTVKQKGAGNCHSDSSHELDQKKTGGNPENTTMTPEEEELMDAMKNYF